MNAEAHSLRLHRLTPQGVFQSLLDKVHFMSSMEVLISILDNLAGSSCARSSLLAGCPGRLDRSGGRILETLALRSFHLNDLTLMHYNLREPNSMSFSRLAMRSSHISSTFKGLAMDTPPHRAKPQSIYSSPQVEVASTCTRSLFILFQPT